MHYCYNLKNWTWKTVMPQKGCLFRIYDFHFLLLQPLQKLFMCNRLGGNNAGQFPKIGKKIHAHDVKLTFVQ